METELQEFYNSQIGPDYVYRHIDITWQTQKEDPEGATYGLMVLLKEKVKFESSMQTKFRICLRKSWSSKILRQREHIAQKETRAAINQELLFISFCFTSTRRKYLKVVSATFLILYFRPLLKQEKMFFYITSKALFGLQIIRF